MKNNNRLFSLKILLLLSCAPLSVEASSSSSSSSSCTSFKEADCKEREICITIPARPANISDPFNTGNTIPSANIFTTTRGRHHKCRPTLVFIHGAGNESEYWACQQDLFCKDYYTVSFDLRGHGQSTKTPAPYPNSFAPLSPGEIYYTMQVFADDVHAVLEALNIRENIVLIGHSIGAGIALNYAANYPGVKKLVSVSGSPLYSTNCELPIPLTTAPCCDIGNAACDTCTTASCCTDSENAACCLYPGTLDGVALEFEFLSACIEACTESPNFEECGIACTFDILVAPFLLNEPCSTNPDFVSLQATTSEFFFAELQTPEFLAIFQSLTLFASSQDQRALLGRVNLKQIPTLLCAGSIDTNVDPRNSLYMHLALKHSKLATFVDKGHELNVTDRAHFNTLLSVFLKGKKLPDNFRVGNQECCVCPASYIDIDFTTCTP